MRRHAVGIFALILLLSGGVLWLFAADYEGTLSVCLRSGTVLAAIWLAYPELARAPRWLAVSALVLLFSLLLIRNPRVWVIGAVVLVVLSKLRPAAASTGRAKRAR